MVEEQRSAAAERARQIRLRLSSCLRVDLLKLYLFSFRSHGDFHEDVVNTIMKDLIKLMDPKYIEVTGLFTPRGGISIFPYANYGRPGTKWERLAEQRFATHE